MNRFLIWFGWALMLGAGLLLLALVYAVPDGDVHRIITNLVTVGLSGGAVSCIGLYLKTRTDHARLLREALRVAQASPREH